MIDFLMISTRSTKRGVIEIYPKFIIKRSSDLMIRGGDFYAIWLENQGLWSTDEQDALELIDKELDTYAKENANRFDGNVRVMHMWDAESGMIDSWHRYCQKQMRDNFHMLDEKLIFSNTKTSKMDYASKMLNYPLEEGDLTGYDKLMSTLYSESERKKIEWAIGAIVTGESKKIQKFVVLYGAAGTGKSTVLNIVQKLFQGYYSVFDAKALGSSSNSFALEAFKSNPLVAIQHDGDLSRIEDNTRLNSLVSHELMTVNEKFKSTYANRFKCFLFMGTNKPVRITDAKSGLIRRLIDVTPSGNKLKPQEYMNCISHIDFELGAIACHCRDVYLNNPDLYNDYIPITMMGASNDFFNFIEDSYYVFVKENSTTLKCAWSMYKEYCEDAKVPYPLSQRSFKEELKNYFKGYKERYTTSDGTRIRNYYSDFLAEKFSSVIDGKNDILESWLKFDTCVSNFDKECSRYPAQYANLSGMPEQSWFDANKTLSEIDTTKLHYVKVPKNHIVIDFDISDGNGNKLLEENIKAASKFPKTYAELSKSGKGIHLHYIYKGDVDKLSGIYDDKIEVKVFNGNSSLRRKLSWCNSLPISEINSGLPMKGENKKMVNFSTVKSEKSLRTLIKRNLNKEIHPGTKPSIDFIHKILEDAYSQGLHYDITDMRNAILTFAANSTHQAQYCIKLVDKMKFKSEDASEAMRNEDAPIVFYDVEVFPNLFLVNWKYEGEQSNVVRMINPKPEEIECLLKYRLIGFNCRRYDNHILYARLMGYTNEQLYTLSQRIISGSPNCFFGEAYNISYTDIYDFASAGNKKSLKKLEIEMGIHHQELGLPWDKPVPKEQWLQVAEYCDNDVIATESAFNYLNADWTARQILADLAEMTVNDTTNSLTTRIIFKRNRKPQNEFNYRDLSQPIFDLDEDTYDFLSEACPEMMNQTHGDAGSLLPYFDGYKYENGKSTYRGEEVGEGGYVYAEPGMYGNIALLDIASMHPHSTIAECLFGPNFTRAFREIVVGRVNIKHEAWDKVDKMLDGKLSPYIKKVINGDMTSKQLANALKTAINSVYGLTAASFENPFKDDRNIDNIVAKRGALFMVDLKNEVQKRGFTVAHIKTDSIKIPDATPDIIDFVMQFGKKYGYTFEHEATYDRMCLVNDAVYIAKYKNHEDKFVLSTGEKVITSWTATGKQFAVPYVFKSLFSRTPINFDDMCETMSVTSSLYLDMNERLPKLSADDEKELGILKRLHNFDNEQDIEKVRKKYNYTPERMEERYSELIEKEKDTHDYIFVGRVGQFCPIQDGCGGGLLMREKDGKYYAATGSKGYRWLESETVRALAKEDCIDMSYYETMANKAVETISKYGDYKWFISDEPYINHLSED